MIYKKNEKISVKLSSELTEKWVQDRIAEDPTILGLGDLVLRDRERPQPRAGRLDLLLQDTDNQRRYEVELQLGATDEAHIIRAIEYWDIERKRYPQYDHCAVLIAENITSRFFNVISLLNGTIPFIAIQMQAIRVEDSLTLVFTKVLDELIRGPVDEDEDAAVAPTDRTYWETKRGTKETVSYVDQVFEIAREMDESIELKYNKFYIGIAKNGQPNNFVTFRPRKSYTYLEIKLPQSDEIDKKIESAGLDTLDYDGKWGRYRIRLSKGDPKKHVASIKDLLSLAYIAKNL